MRKFFAIALLSIHLFNLAGYYALYQYFVYKSDKVMNEHIAKNQYNVNELIEVKIPVNLPYVTSWRNYESISGQVQFKNVCYNYVKLKLTADTMYVKCVPNYEKTRLVSNNVIKVKEIADVPVSKHDAPLIKKSVDDIYHYESFAFQPNNRATVIKQFGFYKAISVAQGVAETPFLPPETV
ncbi:hypothetical protein [Mucilaginibacter ginkgonis]|uniref:Uncharacterized protein n=1 Tax=Mucilaginibacter ginkgonis TaxID=2682091 RepID=A0A6I4I6W5_9SPHI|nr:hypothetical protein [Mucilaginibacter ginkgonis]QQL50754.1 hypothetical protein GO620_004655 [Mucilaginibacter ginkgonis]